MRPWVLLAGVMATALLVALGYGCAVTTSGSCLDNGTCVTDAGTAADGTMVVVRADAAGGGDDAVEAAGGDAGDAAKESGADGGADASCNLSGEPSVDPCLVSDALGVFVSAASGGDTGAGTKVDPLRTMTEGIAKAAGGSKRVFACAGTYDEHVVVAVAQDGVRVYGGFDCAKWAYASGNTVKVEPSTPGYALKVDSLVVGATFEDIEFDSEDAQAPGDSSIAVFANQAVATFRRVVMTAGSGAPGAQGDAGVNYTATRAPSGNNADGGAGGATQVCTCLDGDQTSGGAGGPAGPPSAVGTPGLPALGAGQGGASGTSNCSGGTGSNGAAGSDGDAGLGASSFGSLTMLGWSPSNGFGAGNASAAQGGGGGGGNSSGDLDDAGLSVSGGGGSGGCGGCGGGGGTPGQGGGSSFVLLSFNSNLTLVGCRLAAHDGKNGGAGGVGQAGEPGGYAGNSSAPGCPGGNGGSAGGGGGGGGGAGGVSAAIGYAGSVPTETNTVSKMVGNFGTGGAGGAGGASGNAGGKGVDGVASVVLSL